MSTCLFRSPLASRLQGFLEARRSGRRDRSQEKILFYLDRFLLEEIKPGQPITRQVVERWVEGMMHLSPGTRRNRICVMRQFCIYLSHFDPRTCVVCRNYGPHRTRPAPHIYTPAEVRRIMAAAQKLGPPGSLRPVVVSTLIGVLYTTGLRIGEALNLTLADLDLKHRIIEVREGKFGKSRNVPVSPSTASHLEAYLRSRRKAGFSMAPTTPVFPNLMGTRHGHPGFVTVFLKILRKLGLRGPKGERGPRIHDLRHSFAVNRLLAWYREGVHLGSKIPLLSTYLGHSTITGTDVYLHATAQLLESAGRRFHSYFADPPAAKGKQHDKD